MPKEGGPGQRGGRTKGTGLSPQGNWGSLDLSAFWGHHGWRLRAGIYTGGTSVNSAWSPEEGAPSLMDHSLASQRVPQCATFPLRSQDAVSLHCQGVRAFLQQMHYPEEDSGLDLQALSKALKMLYEPSSPPAAPFSSRECWLHR